MKNLIIFFSLIFLSCKSNLDQKFEEENDNLKTEFKIQSEKFVKENHSKLTDQEMLHSLDSITESFIITKNKLLAVKYVESKSGLKRLNFLKKEFTKDELKTILKRVPKSIQQDTNYTSIKKYIEN